jgi:hypothetical protein
MVSSQNIYFLAAIGLFLTALLLVAGYYYRLARRSAQVSWQQLLANITFIDRNVIAVVALDRMDDIDLPDAEAGSQRLDSYDLWTVIGGLKGLEILEQNSKVLIELACYLQRWHPEALPIAEQLRLDSRALQFHVDRLKGAAKTGNLEVSFPFYAQRAVATYYVMTRRLLALYEAANSTMLPELQRAI